MSFGSSMWSNEILIAKCSFDCDCILCLQDENNPECLGVEL